MPRTKTEKIIKEEPLETQLWKAADKLRKNIDAAEYKHVVLGLIFLKYISDSFVEMFDKLQSGEGEYAGADPEDRDEYTAENVFFVPAAARWAHLVSVAKLPDVGKYVDAAMDAIEKENPSLRGVLPKVYAKQNLDPASLGGLIDLIGNIALGDAKSRSADVLGHVFEYFLGEFALAEGKQGGQFYTPRAIVELLVAMLEPYKGRVFDPCCGSGGMFVQSEKFVEEHQGRRSDISIYGQESNQTTWRLAKMNLAIRGIDSSQVKWNNEGSFLNDAHKDLKADFIIANPPFNVSDWSGDLLRGDGRWKYGAPPEGNANFAWLQHFVYHLSPTGKAGVVLAKGALTSKTSGEGDIRKALIADGNLIDCIVNLPAKLFLNTQIPAALWFMRRGRNKPSPQPSPSGRGSKENPLPQQAETVKSPLPLGEDLGEGSITNYRGGLEYATLVKRARQLRQDATPPEKIFWQLVRARQFMNLKFRRQHQIGNYIADFYCHEQNLVIEFDGSSHGIPGRQEKDQERDAYLKSLGMHVLRIHNDDFLVDPVTTLDYLADYVERKNPHPSPLPKGEGAKTPHPNELEAAQSPLPNEAEAAKSPLPNEVGAAISPLPLGEDLGEGKDRSNEILFIDARNLGHLINRRTKVLSAEDIAQIAGTYHAWRSGKGEYQDIKGFCASASLERVAELDYVLTPGRYVGLPEEEDDFDFAERFAALKKEFEAQLVEEEKLNQAIKESLGRVRV